LFMIPRVSKDDETTSSKQPHPPKTPAPYEINNSNYSNFYNPLLKSVIVPSPYKVDTTGKMTLEPRFGGLLWNFTSRFCIMSCSLIAKFFLRFCTKSTTIYNKEPFVRVLMDPNRTRPILTVANHLSTVDDPLLWGSLPFCITKSTRTIRWTLGAQEICFTNNFLSHFFALGQVVPTVRGAGIYQPAMNFALDKLNEKEGNWVHIFPEGKINQTSSMIPLRWGVGRLMMESKNPPIVVPLWHKGLETVMPEERDNPFVPILWQKVVIAFGEPIDLKDVLTEFHEGKAE
ncbi:1424_t:CDS:2, partial [Ambispora leptoticha]